jgi:hypothetical protein
MSVNQEGTISDEGQQGRTTYPNLRSSQAELRPSRSTQRFDWCAWSRAITRGGEHRLRSLSSRRTRSRDDELTRGRHGGGAKGEDAKGEDAKGEDALRIEERDFEIDKLSRTEIEYVVEQKFPTTLVYMYTSPSFSILVNDRRSSTIRQRRRCFVPQRTPLERNKTTIRNDKALSPKKNGATIRTIALAEKDKAISIFGRYKLCSFGYSAYSSSFDWKSGKKPRTIARDNSRG